jgi:ribonuclease Z
VYSSDTRPCASLIEAAEDADLLIHECTFSEEELGRAAETRHSTARQAAEVAARAGVHRLVLTHFSARHSEQAHRLVKEAREIYPAVEAADDGLEIEVPLPADAGVAGR